MPKKTAEELRQERDRREEEELEAAQKELPLWMVAAVPDKIIDWVEDLCSPKKVERAKPLLKDENETVRPGSAGGQVV